MGRTFDLLIGVLVESHSLKSVVGSSNLTEGGADSVRVLLFTGRSVVTKTLILLNAGNATANNTAIYTKHVAKLCVITNRPPIIVKNSVATKDAALASEICK